MIGKAVGKDELFSYRLELLLLLNFLRKKIIFLWITKSCFLCSNRIRWYRKKTSWLTKNPWTNSKSSNRGGKSWGCDCSHSCKRTRWKT